MSLTWKSKSIIEQVSSGKGTKYRMYYSMTEKKANAVLEVKSQKCNLVKIFGNDFNFLEKVANGIEIGVI